MLAALLSLATAVAAEPPPPAPLTCLARHYALEPHRANGRWYGRLPDGTSIPYDDGRAKSLAELFAQPDLEDMFAIPYRRGPIRPVSDPGDDPGRVRVEPIFAATYGRSAAEVKLVVVDFLEHRVEVHARAAEAFRRVAARLAEARRRAPALAPFLRRLAGTFAWRTIAGTDRRSAHAYGVAIDLATSVAHYWRWQRPRSPLRWRNRIPQPIVDAFEAEGFIWGGRWYHYDTMHFEYRPELLDPTCQPRPTSGPRP